MKTAHEHSRINKLGINISVFVSSKNRTTKCIRQECQCVISFFFLKKGTSFHKTSLTKLLIINHINICIALRVFRHFILFRSVNVTEIAFYKT